MTSRSTLFLHTAIRAGIPYGIIMTIFWYIQALFVDEPLRWWWQPLATGICATVLFGLAMGWFVARKVRNSAPPQFAGGEPVVLEAPANHFRKIEAVGGNLYLTDRRLVFKPHQINAQRRELSIPLSDIAELRPVPTMWVVPNGLLVTTRNGGSERFVVENREGWIGKIEETTSHTLRL